MVSNEAKFATLTLSTLATGGIALLFYIFAKASFSAGKYSKTKCIENTTRGFTNTNTNIPGLGDTLHMADYTFTPYFGTEANEGWAYVKNAQGTYDIKKFTRANKSFNSLESMINAKDKNSLIALIHTINSEDIKNRASIIADYSLTRSTTDKVKTIAENGLGLTNALSTEIIDLGVAKGMLKRGSVTYGGAPHETILIDPAKFDGLKSNIYRPYYILEEDAAHVQHPKWLGENVTIASTNPCADMNIIPANSTAVKRLGIKPSDLTNEKGSYKKFGSINGTDVLVADPDGSIHPVRKENIGDSIAIIPGSRSLITKE